MKSRYTVVVVDDSVESLNFLTDALEDAGLTVLVALTGESAISLIERSGLTSCSWTRSCTASKRAAD